MLEAIGVQCFDDLLADMPSQIRLKAPLRLPEPLSELEAERHLAHLAATNLDPNQWISFLGAGAYDHYVPSIIDHIVARSEFYTAYTPYQPEISQGTLQTIYEYQSLIARLTAMEIANASLYDCASAIAEAVLMANHLNQRKRIVVSGCLHPHHLNVLQTYMRSGGFEIKITDWRSGKTEIDEVRELIDSNTSCVVVENPNFFGSIEDVAPIVDLAHKHGALAVVSVDPVSLGVLAPPGEYDADIAVGEGQSLGCRLSYGGPYLGFLATRKRFIRRLPGRIVGKTCDANGKTCYCLTLQTREQHIRRQRATSNICTNQALMALRAAIYLCWLGRAGIRELAMQCLARAAYAAGQLEKVGIERRFKTPFFREFAARFPVEADEILVQLAGRKILGGVSLGRFFAGEKHSLLMAFTEKRTRIEIDALVESVREIIECANKAG